MFCHVLLRGCLLRGVLKSSYEICSERRKRGCGKEGSSWLSRCAFMRVFTDYAGSDWVSYVKSTCLSNSDTGAQTRSQACRLDSKCSQPGLSQHSRPPPRMHHSLGTVLANARKGDDTVRNPHRAQLSQFELFELILLFKFDKQLPVEQFEATVSQSTVPSPPPINAFV